MYAIRSYSDLGQHLQILLAGTEYLQRQPPTGTSAEVMEEMLRAVRRLKSVIHRIQNITRYETRNNFV